MSEAIAVMEKELATLGGHIPEVDSTDTAMSAEFYLQNTVKFELDKIDEFMGFLRAYKNDALLIEAGTKQNLIDFMEREKIDELYFPKLKRNLKTHLSQGKVEITDRSIIPGDYTEVKVTPIINKISTALKAGLKVKGAKLVKKITLTRTNKKLRLEKNKIKGGE